MKSFMSHLLFNIVIMGGIIMCLFVSTATAQGLYSSYGLYSPYTYGNSLLTYGYPGVTNPLVGGGFLLGGNYPYGSAFSPLSQYNPFYFPNQLFQMYSYLNYCLRFYEIARQTPFFYLYDQSADYIGANLYNYAGTLGVSPQEAIIYFIQENLL